METHELLQKARIKAFQFTRRWKDEESERRGAVTFWDEFFTVFGLYRRQFAQVEHPLSGGRRIDLFWPKQLLVEHKGRGLLKDAFRQALDYTNELPAKDRPKFIITCDFQSFHKYELIDSGYKETSIIKLEELADRIEEFGFMVGQPSVHFAPLDELNFAAAERLGQVVDALQKDHYKKTDLSELLVRIVFCMFADHTGIFEKGSFASYLQNALNRNENVGAALNLLFDTLNTDKANRSANISTGLSIFPYVNGKLFERNLAPAPITEDICSTLIDVSHADWRRVSPAIFGALFQCIMDPSKRANLGEHYTSEQNILRVLRPLFLDALRDELFSVLSKAGPQKRSMLTAYRQKLKSINVLDPACGCGNFLVVAYRELRLLDIAALKALQTNDDGTQQILDLTAIDSFSITSLHGFEIEDFPCKVAEVALWVIDHLMNVRASEELGRYYIRLPIDVKADIKNVDALLTDWSDIGVEGSRQLYIVGNPPFLGASVQSKSQKESLATVFGALSSVGDLDYVTGWFVKSAQFVKGHPRRRCALVATSSIAQGEQVTLLWNALKKMCDLQISFGYRPFKWSNEAPNVAQVFVVIVGLQDVAPENPRIYQAAEKDTFKLVKNVSPYIIDYKYLLVSKRTRPISNVPRMAMGNKPSDEGHLILDAAQREALIQECEDLGLGDELVRVLRPYVGTTEFLTGAQRWCLWFQGYDHRKLLVSKTIAARINSVKAFRQNSTAADTNAAASTPHLFFRTPQPPGECLIFPETTSENREYVPVGRTDDKTILSNGVFFIPELNWYIFGVISSKIHQLWARSVGGRLENRIRYSSRNVYNTFPFPDEAPAKRREAVIEAAKLVAAAQDGDPASMEAKYDAQFMAVNLRQAHLNLDRAVERCFRAKPFADDAERLVFMLDRYDAIITPLDRTTRTRSKKASPDHEVVG